MNATIKTILNQFGGPRSLVMIGGMAYQINDVKVSIRFKVRAKNKAKWVTIELTPADLYTVSFQKNNGDTISSFDGIYADMLQSVFIDETGLYLSL